MPQRMLSPLGHGYNNIAITSQCYSRISDLPGLLKGYVLGVMTFLSLRVLLFSPNTRQRVDADCRVPDDSSERRVDVSRFNHIVGRGHATFHLFKQSMYIKFLDVCGFKTKCYAFVKLLISDTVERKYLCTL